MVALAKLEDDGLPTTRSQQSQLVSPSEGTLVLYLLYFSIDKASPHAPSVVVFTHALSLNSALLLGVRFGLLAAISAPAFGSSMLWSHELNRRMGGAPDEIGGAPDEIGGAPDEFGAVPSVRETVLPAIALHVSAHHGAISPQTVLPAIALLLWPMLAMLADLRLRWGELRRCYGMLADLRLRWGELRRCYGRFHRVRWLVALGRHQIRKLR